MSRVEKIPLKHAELSINKFNEVAIPHHTGLLKNHKSNIEKCLALGDWTKVKKEEINAMRVMKQLKNLLLEMDGLRKKIRDHEVEKFDSLIYEGKLQANLTIREFMVVQAKITPSTKEGYESQEEIESELRENLPQIQTSFQSQDHQLRARQACLDEVENLNRDVDDLHEMFRNVHGIVQEQGEKVEVIAENAEEALENVTQGESNLRQALKYKKTLYPVVGAFVGTCVGGPIGLIAGIKAGGLAAIGCGILGFTGGSVLKMNDVTTGIPEEKKED